MAKRYKLYPEARSDLENIWLYSVEKWGVNQADRYLEELEQDFKYLADNPQICRERNDLTPPVRIHHQGRHLIIYLVEFEQISIIRVIHDHVDIKRHL